MQQLIVIGKGDMRLLVLLLTAMILAGCTPEELLQRISTPERQAEAKLHIDQLRRHDFDAIERALAPELVTAQLRNELETMAGLLPAQEPTSIKLVGAQSMTDDGTTVNSTFEYRFGSKWFLINVAVRERGADRKIVGFHVSPEEGPVAELNRFSLAGKSPAHYFVLAVAVANVALTVIAAYFCARTRMARKWRWMLFILFGFTRFSINWSSGEWSFDPLYFQLFSAGAFAAPFGPWIISISVPVGAIWFLATRGKRVPEPSPA
jgi:hypothetical protein